MSKWHDRINLIFAFNGVPESTRFPIASVLPQILLFMTFRLLFAVRWLPKLEEISTRLIAEQNET